MTHHFNQSLSHLTKYEQNNSGLQLYTKQANVSIQIFRAGIVRIRICKLDEQKADFSYAVCAQPQPTDFSIEETTDFLQVNTPKLRLQIQKNPLRFAFYTIDNQLINEDDASFGTSWLGTEVSTYKRLQEGERFIGLGEKTGNLDRRGESYINWNTDYFAYPTNGDPLYVTTPFYMGIHHQLAYGIFFDNSHRSVFNFGASNDRFAYFSADAGDMDYYFIYDESVAGILQQYAFLTGKMPLPPRWSLGLQQCRYSYFPDSEVLRIAQTFREKDIPADVIYLDIHYMDAYKIFTWDAKRFPTPAKMLKQLTEMGFDTTIIVDPGIKKEEGYGAYEEGKAADLFVKYPDGENYTANVWPGACHFPDFTHDKTRKWWGQSFASYVANGLTGFWNDMNEPASWGQCSPNLLKFDFDGHKTTFREARNVYGMQMTRATYEGTRYLLNGKRPFILTRAGYSGVQRYAAVWTGDNSATDDHLLLGVRLVNSLGLTGVAYAGYDVGGFCGNASPDLFARWLSVGAFSPFFRCHSMVNSRAAEPWTFGEHTTDIARNYVKLRYQLMPYLYATFFEASQTGLPVSRSLAINYTFEEKVYDVKYQNQYLFGKFILVAPLNSQQQIAKVYLPKGDWYDLYTDKKYVGNSEVYLDAPPERLPLLIKEGAIIPMQSVVPHLKQQSADTLFVHIYDGKMATDFIYYEDDGQTYAYKEGVFYKRMIQFLPENTRKKIVFSKVTGTYQSNFKHIRLYFHAFDNLEKVLIDEEILAIQQETYKFVEPLTCFDPLGNTSDLSKKIENLPFVEFKNETRFFEVIVKY